MAEEQFQERTERATPRRREKAREEGRVARSNELNSAVILTLGITTLYFLGPVLVNRLQLFMKYIFSEAPNMSGDIDSMIALFQSNILNFFLLLGPILVLIGIIAYAINVLQVGMMFSTKSLEPKLDKLNIVNGLKRLFSVRSMVELIRDIIKLTLIATIAYFAIKAELPVFYNMSDNTVGALAAVMGKTSLMISLKIGLVLLILALFDYAFQKYDFEKSIRMTKQEIREENKDTEGSPEVKSRIKRIQREMSRKRMMQEIPKADVVITNPTHLAIAIKYDQEEMSAPMVIAKGERLLAEKIKEIAKEAGVPIVENKPLARALYEMCDIGSTVPSKLYRAVAEVLAYVYRLKEEKVS